MKKIIVLLIFSAILMTCIFLLRNILPGISNFILFQTPTPTLTQDQITKIKREKFVEENLSKMSLEEKVGQMFMWGINEASLSAKSQELIEKTFSGGVIIMGKHPLSEIRNLTGQIKKISIKIPLFIAFDGEIEKWAKINPENNIAKNIDSLSEQELCDVYGEITDDLKNAGINVNFGIMADIGWFSQSYIKTKTSGG